MKTIGKLLTNKKAIYLLLVALIVFGVIIFFFWRSAIFSKEILKMEILGPESVKAGSEITYTVKYKNNGNVTLNKPKIIFELPEHSLTEDSKVRFVEELDDIYPGQERTVQFHGRLLGKEQDLKVAKASLTYVPNNLSVRYESYTTLTTKIDAVPITLTYDAATKVEKGKEVSYSINYFSNVDYPLENLSVRVDKIEGFDIKSSTPASLDNAEWKLETLSKGQGGRINIKGMVTGDIGETLNLSARLGMWQDGVFVVIKEATQDVETTQPLLFISQLINGSSNYTASPGETLTYQIFFRNIGATAFNNLFVMVRLEGSAYDLSTVSSQDGKANANDNLIIFDSKEIFGLAHLYPKQETKVTFSVKLKSSLPSGEQIITSKINVLDMSQEFTTKINSQMDVWQKVYRVTTNGIENFGPIPPKVGESTSYAVVWEVKNYLNDLKNVRIKAILPQNVSLVDNIYPESEAPHFSFDSKSREIVWSAGNLASSQSAKLTFQIVINPSSFQVGGMASLIGQATVFAEDQFTNAVIQKSVLGATTGLADDKDNSGGGIVR